jgi:hypothetical protein
MQPPTAKVRTAAIEAVLNGMTIGIAMGLRPEGFISESGDQVRMEMRRSVRGDEHSHPIHIGTKKRSRV